MYSLTSSLQEPRSNRGQSSRTEAGWEVPGQAEDGKRAASRRPGRGCHAVAEGLRAQQAPAWRAWPRPSGAPAPGQHSGRRGCGTASPRPGRMLDTGEPAPATSPRTLAPGRKSCNQTRPPRGCPVLPGCGWGSGGDPEPRLSGSEDGHCTPLPHPSAAWLQVPVSDPSVLVGTTDKRLLMLSC